MLFLRYKVVEVDGKYESYVKTSLFGDWLRIGYDDKEGKWKEESFDSLEEAEEGALSVLRRHKKRVVKMGRLD